LESFSFVGGLPLPCNPFVRTRAVLGSQAREDFDITANRRNDLPDGHVVVDSLFDVFTNTG
jgi:hypothetical protein